MPNLTAAPRALALMRRFMPLLHLRDRIGTMFLAALALCFPWPSALAGTGVLLSEREVKEIVAPLFNRHEVKGLAVGLLSPSGRAVYGYGLIKGTRGPAPSGRTVFEIGSITKTFTGVLLAMAQMEGKLDLTDPVSRYLPSDVAGPESPFSGMAILDLATHSSGLPERPDNMPSADPLNPFAGYDLPLFYDFLRRFTPSRPVGARFEYSNAGAALAGLILSRVYGKPYEELVRDKICAPLGMLETRITLPDSMKRAYAPGHNQALTRVPAWEVPVFEAAGALRSTPDDLLTYAAANLGLAETPLLSPMLLSHIPRFHVAEIPELFIGLFWNAYNFKGHRYVMHAGRSGGFFALIMLDPARKTGVVLLSNAEGDLTKYGWNILEKLR